MKLLYCDMCHDVVKLGYSIRHCDCGASSGKYLEDGLNAEIHGDFAMVLGFANSTFVRALDNHDQHPEGEESCGSQGMNYGWRFEAFVIPEPCPTVKRLP